MQDGILLLNKDVNMTSRDLVNLVCKKFNTKKVGHTGTLDPFATGLMIITLNKATKISSFIEATRKKYIAELTLGIETDTLDLDGKIINQEEVKELDKEEIKKVFASFIGEIEQIPPMYSALKQNGIPLYKLARNNISVERKARKVTIYSLNILSLYKNKIVFEVECSKGTYVRTLANDIAHKLNTFGHLSMLTRTNISLFSLKDAKNIDEIEESDVISIKDALSFMPKVYLNEVLSNKAKNGVRLILNSKEEKILLLQEDNMMPIAIYERKEDGSYTSLRGLF